VHGETSEGFGADYSLRDNSYCAACSSCGEIFFQWKMHLAYHDAQYADLYEQTMFNALLGAVDLPATTFYYTNPLAANASRTSWHACPCCVGNIPRTLLMLPTWMYSKDREGVYVNLFVGSSVRTDDVAGTSVEMVQATDYPWDGKVSITVKPAAPRRFAIRIRSPRRDVSELYTASPKADGIGKLTVNGTAVKAQEANGYLAITREWKTGDTIELVTPMAAQRVHASEKIAANAGRVALRYGPLVYNIEQVDQDITGVLDPASELKAEWRPDLLDGVTVIKGTFADGRPLLAVPNYARYNRNPADPPPAPVAPPEPGQPGPRPASRPVTSTVWIREREGTPTAASSSSSTDVRW
jgi:DUF1680 family protein